MSYQAPVSDIAMALGNSTQIYQIMAQKGFEDAEDLVSAILDEAAKLANQSFAPLNYSGDKEGVKCANQHVQTPNGFQAAYQEFVAGAWGSIQFPEEYGGQNLPFVLAVAVQEMIHAANMALGLCPLLTQGAVEAIEKNASATLKEKYLPNLIQANWTGTMNLTEPQAGSDLSTIRTTAKKEGDHYLITGQKCFITWGEHDLAENIIHLVLARLPDAPAGSKGISLFLVPKYLVNEDGSLGGRNDCHVVSVEEKMGIHASPTCVMSFGDNGGAIGYLIGQENQGLACMFTMMNNARLTVGLQGVSLSESAYQLAKNYTLERIQGIAPGFSDLGAIYRHPDVQRMLLTMQSLTHGSRFLTYWACQEVDLVAQSQGELRQEHANRLALLTPLVKSWCTEMAQEVTSLGVQCHGGAGFIEEAGAAQLMRDARILPIYEGTNGIQALDLLHRKIIKDQAAALHSLLHEIQSTLMADTSRNQDWANMLMQAISAVQVQTQFVLEHQDNPQLIGALAHDYLMLLSYAVVGYLMWQQMQQPQSEAYKISQFYLLQILPRYLSHEQKIQTALASLDCYDLQH